MPRLRDRYSCVVCLLLLFTFVATVHAQGATATLSGVVTDQAGAVLP